MIAAALFIVFPFCMLYAAVSDLMSMTITNRIPVILVTTFFCLAILTGMPWMTIGWHVLAGLLVLAATFGLFAMGSMGGGDAKLMAATATWMGLGSHLLSYLLLAAVLGGGLTIFLLAYRKSAFAHLWDRPSLPRSLSLDTKGIPYGIALGAAGLIVYPQTELMAGAVARLTGTG